MERGPSLSARVAESYKFRTARYKRKTAQIELGDFIF
jgi:hypothetical protein